jgi:hypothetical protein
MEEFIQNEEKPVALGSSQMLSTEHMPIQINEQPAAGNDSPMEIIGAVRTAHYAHKRIGGQ